MLIGFSDNVQVDTANLYSGADGHLLHEFTTGSQFPWTIGFAGDGAGDTDGDGIPELILGAPYSYSGSIGNAYLVALNPFLTPSSAELSLNAGQPLTLSLDFPAGEAGADYIVLASATGIGPSLVGGLDIPLSADALLAQMSSGWQPPLLQNGIGQLDANAHADATLNAGSQLTPWIGRTIQFCAVTFNRSTGLGITTSLSRRVTFVP